MNAGAHATLAYSWLLLIHQLPAKPAYLRVKIWRRLQDLGAIAVKHRRRAFRIMRACTARTWTGGISRLKMASCEPSDSSKQVSADRSRFAMLPRDLSGLPVTSIGCFVHALGCRSWTTCVDDGSHSPPSD